jgi:nucleoside-diphosphate-sugar epimerase
MRVLISGGTGFVGSHIVAAAVRAGHDVRLLVRRPERVGPALAPLGIQGVDTVTGDVLDPASVQAAVENCDAIVNAAAVYSLDPGEARQVLATNPRATEIVLEAAVATGLDPIIHVSSYVALLPSDAVLDADTPVGENGPAYPRSKAESELIARHHQAGGAPVVTTYPGAVVGPDDPYFGDSAFTIAMILRNRVPFALAGGWPVADVRYIADAHAAMLTPGRGPRRYLLTGHYKRWCELYRRSGTSPGGDFPRCRPRVSSAGPAAGPWTAYSGAPGRDCRYATKGPGSSPSAPAPTTRPPERSSGSSRRRSSRHSRTRSDGWCKPAACRRNWPESWRRPASVHKRPART